MADSPFFFSLYHVTDSLQAGCLSVLTVPSPDGFREVLCRHYIIVVLIQNRHNPVKKLCIQIEIEDGKEHCVNGQFDF